MRKAWIAALIAVSPMLLSSAADAQPAAPTTVTLTFDGALADTWQVRELLSMRQFHASFFASSALIGHNGYLTKDQLTALQSDGNEIGGHTTDGTDLLSPTLDDAERARQICVDRSWLLANGFQVGSFAFPQSKIGEPANSDVLVNAVAQCGYGAARQNGGLDCTRCPSASPLPPQTPLKVPAISTIVSTTTLVDLEGYVTAAQPDGGWVVLTAEHLCDGPSCDTLSISTATLTGFLDWLKSQEPTGVSVRTLGEVIGQPIQPAVAGPPPNGPGPDGNLLRNGSLEQDSRSDGIPDCWQKGGEGDNSFLFERTADAHEGGSALQIQITTLNDGARRLVSLQDLGSCAPGTATDHRYRVTGWTKLKGLGSLVAYYRDSSGAWTYWAKSPHLATSDGYQQVDWVTPPMPAEALGISVGASLESPGTLTMDDFRLEDLGVNPGGCATASTSSTEGAPILALGLLLAASQISRRNRS